jgi:DNA invertase Pin-like site-specific DNA recombinase
VASSDFGHHYVQSFTGESCFSREGLDALMAEVRQGRVDVLAVHKLDRLGRSLQHLAQLIGEFEAHGTALIATSQGIDTSEADFVSDVTAGHSS